MKPIIKEVRKDETDMRPIYYVEVKAFSEEHAKKIMSGILNIPLLNIIKVERIQSSKKKVNQCKTENYPVKGIRKWKTVYEVYAYGVKVPTGHNKFMYLDMELVQTDIETKTEALKIAHEMALKHRIPMTVQITQKLETHTSTCADVTPKTNMEIYAVHYFK